MEDKEHNKKPTQNRLKLSDALKYQVLIGTNKRSVFRISRMIQSFFPGNLGHKTSTIDKFSKSPIPSSPHLNFLTNFSLNLKLRILSIQVKMDSSIHYDPQ